MSTGGHDASFHRGVRRGAKALFQDRFDEGGFYNAMEISILALCRQIHLVDADNIELFIA